MKFDFHTSLIFFHFRHNITFTECTNFDISFINQKLFITCHVVPFTYNRDLINSF